MSRVGKTPIAIPAGVSLQVAERKLTVKGPKGSLELELRPEVEVEVSGQQALVKANGKGTERESSAYHGMTRALINNMVAGVQKVYEKRLEVVGVGWNASAQGRKIVLNAGYCKPIALEIPKGVDAVTPSATSIVITSMDKQAVGQLAARIRKVRPPEPYKGKGVRYVDEVVKRKAGKSFGS